MIAPLIKGIFLGLTITISLGPGFFAMFRTTLSHGFKAGLTMATGILISDLTLISLGYLGLANFINDQQLLLSGIIGGTILIAIGIVLIIKKPKNSPNNTEISINVNNKSITLFLAQGFILNLTNPLNLIFWIGVLGFAGNTFGLHSPDFFVFFTGLILTAFSSDILKCYLSGLLKNILTARYIGIMNKITGIVFLFAGSIVIYKVL